MEKLNVLITSPSIDPNNNISGIANLTRLLVTYNNSVEYSIFVAGRRDNEKKNLWWLINQVNVFFIFCRKLLNKKLNIVHINMPLEKMAIIRDSIFSLLSNLFNKAYVIHIRGGKYSLNKNTPYLLKLLIKNSLKRSSRVIVLGYKEKKYIIKNYDINNKKIIVLPNCVKIPEQSKNKSIDSLKTVQFLYLGRIDKKKGLKQAIDALSSLQNKIHFRFVVAGDGEDKKWLLKYAYEKLGNNFVFKGVIFGVEKDNVLSNSNIFLLPSHYEGLPNALLEAMSYGIVPIVTPVGSIPEVVKHKKNGLIVSVNSPEEIIRCIELLYYNKYIYEQLSEQAINTVLINYSLENYINKINRIYHSIN